MILHIVLWIMILSSPDNPHTAFVSFWISLMESSKIRSLGNTEKENHLVSRAKATKKCFDAKSYSPVLPLLE